MRGEFDTHLRRIITQGIDEGVFQKVDPKVVGYRIVGAINFLPQWFSSKGPLSREEIKNQMRNYLMRGILKTERR